MFEFMAWLQGSPLGHAMRESGLWTYAVVNLGHILGVAALFGAVLVLDLRLLGVAKRLPLAPLASLAVPIAATGFALAVLTGTGLLATKATEYVDNPFLYVKLPVVAVGAINALVLAISPAWRARDRRPLSPDEERHLAWMGGISLACWCTAVAAGRLIGYW